MAQDKVDDFPSVDGLHQGEDPALVCIPVNVQNTVRTEVMPSFVSIMNRVELETTAAHMKLLNEDPSRKRVTIIAADDGILVSAKEEHIAMDVAAMITPLGAPLVLETCSEIWIAPIPTATATATVSYVVEQWAR